MSSQQLTTGEADEMATAIARRFQWDRNLKNNLVRRLNGRVLTVFPRKPLGLYYWSIAYKDAVTFSNGGYRTEQEAMESVEAIARRLPT